MKLAPELAWAEGPFLTGLDAAQHVGVSFPALSGSPRVSLKPNPMAVWGRKTLVW